MIRPCAQHAYTPILSFHAGDPLPLIKKIHERGMKAGVAVSPDTPSAAITDDIGNAADMLLVMTVYPGTFLGSIYLPVDRPTPPTA